MYCVFGVVNSLCFLCAFLLISRCIRYIFFLRWRDGDLFVGVAFLRRRNYYFMWFVCLAHSGLLVAYSGNHYTGVVVVTARCHTVYTKKEDKPRGRAREREKAVNLLRGVFCSGGLLCYCCDFDYFTKCVHWVPASSWFGVVAESKCLGTMCVAIFMRFG